MSSKSSSVLTDALVTRDTTIMAFCFRTNVCDGRGRFTEELLYRLFRQCHSTFEFLALVPRVLFRHGIAYLDINFLTFLVTYRASQAGSLVKKWVYPHCSASVVQPQ